MEKGTYAFIKLRRALAPSLRSLLEHVGPLRFIGVRMMRWYLKPVVQWDGFTVSVDPTDFGVSFELESTGHYEIATMEYCKKTLKPGMTFVDVGANVGLFTIMAARAVGPTGKVYAFEPDAGNAALIKKNVDQNGLSNVTIIQKAVSDTTGSLTLFQSGFNTGDHRTYHVSKGRKQVQVDCIALDDYFPVGTRIDILKMDIEGYEATALRGMRRIVQAQPSPQMIIECWPSMLKKAGSVPEDIFTAIEAQGFALSLIDDAAVSITPMSARDAVKHCWDNEVANILCVRK